MDIKKLETIMETTKKKRVKNFLETFYNNNFRLQTNNLHMINAAYEVKDELNLRIGRIDYSNDYVIRGEK